MTKLIRALAAIALLAACTEDVSGPDGPAPDVTYRFGAKFEPPVGRIVHGLGQWDQYNPAYLALLPAELRPASQLLFVDIGDTPRGWQPDLIAERIAAIDAAGMIPNVDIALRGLQPLPHELDDLPDPYYGIDDEIAHGSAYDSRILDIIEIAKDYGRPIMMRIGGEFSGAWNGYHPWDYPKAFRKIVQMFRQHGADNVAFIWCYMPAAAADFEERDASGEWKWYPGDDVVDWFGIDWFHESEFTDISGGRGIGGSYDRSIAFLDMAVTEGKPVIIAESAPSAWDFGDAAQASSAWTAWFDPYFEILSTRPEILWFHYINYDWTQAGHYQLLGWKNNDLAVNAGLAQKYVTELSDPRYLHSGERSLLNGWSLYP